MSRATVTRAIAIVFLLVVLAGCTGTPFSGDSGQQGSVTLDVENAADDPHTFEAWVVELPGEIHIHRGDGTVSNVAVGTAGISTYDPGEHRTITAVEPPDSATHHGRWDLAPGEANRSEIDTLPEQFAVLVVVYRSNGEVASIVDSTCTDGDFVSLNVTMRNYGTDTSRPSC